nr:transporter substrate-binding protein [uncultured Agrobacterium sp.]
MGSKWFLSLARHLIREQGCRQIVGTIISSARKGALPLVEKHDGLLWYMCPYVSFEANENTIYTGGCPNQHLIPIFE